jgi:exopolysaccharide biosynthesis WecB/TagA/CpsF family protein
VVLVPAHDEAGLIGRCVSSLLAQGYPREQYRVVVVADNCADETASIARAVGAEVMTRNVPDAPGKGRALRWAMDGILAGDAPFDAFVVVDADSVAAPGLLSGLEAELAAGHDAVQANYEVLAEAESRGSDLGSAAFLLFHRVRFSGRAALGMPAFLVGNGMLFSRRLIEQHPWDAFTGVEDLEYTISLRLAGVRPRFAPGASVAGPPPATRAGSVRQRMRWEGGRFHVVRTRLWMLIREAVVRRDAGLADAAIDLATPPLSLLCMIAYGGAAIAAVTVLARAAAPWALVPWLVAALALPGFVFAGLWVAGAPGLITRVLRSGPRFVAWKLLTYGRLARGFDVNRWERSDRRTAVAPEVTERVDVAGVPIDPVDMQEAVATISRAASGQRLFRVTTVNLDFLVRARTDPRVRAIFVDSDLNLADGAPVVWLSRLMGKPIPARVTGADLVPALIGPLAASGARLFLLGGEGGVAARAAAKLLEAHPNLVVAGTYEPPRSAVENMDNAAIIARIGEARADVLLVALGHPKQELWIERHREQLPVSVAIGVGCVFDLIAGRQRRAPGWMRTAGLEWAYRLGREPRRLVSRYVTDAAWLIPIAILVLRRRFSSARVREFV